MGRRFINKRLYELVREKLPDSGTESSTDRDGFLSYATEWHALTLGLALGVSIQSQGQLQRASQLVFSMLGLAKTRRSWNKKMLREGKKEPWYFLGGMVIGLLAALVLTGGALLV